MHFYQDKKSMVKGFIIMILLLSAGFLLITAILKIFEGKAEAATLDSICKGSVALRAKTHYDVKFRGVKAGEVATPLLCRTGDLYLPEDKDATKEDVKKEIAEWMASCWDRYGEGLIEDVFNEGDLHIKNCQVCYTVSLRETSKFKVEDGITSTEFLQYLFETPYKVSPENDGCKVEGGFCINSEDSIDCGEKIDADDSYLLIDKKSSVCKGKGKTACCYTDYECWNRGGICGSTNPNVDEYKQYDEWDCPSEMECFVEDENYYSYGEYIQRYGGLGNLMVLTNIKPGETYAISFGSHTGECGFWCDVVGAVPGGVIGGAVFVVAVALAVPSAGTSLAVAAAYVGAFGLGVGAGLVTQQIASEAMEGYVVNIADFFDEANRNTNTIYLTTLDQIQEGEGHCRIVHELGET